MWSKNLTKENIEKIGKLFPNVITEVKDKKGNITHAIDFELLQQELSDEIVEGNKERYQLTWPGKKEAIVRANTPIDKTLRPVKEDSLNWEETENLYIEGDNLEVLKLLQESYLNKIKCIYIDPPYNTGKDFIYKDNFTQDKDEYLEESGQVDEDGNRLFQNTEYNGRFHSDWLTMMYPRLKLARNLLAEDGVIFISIDDNEVHNLRKICDEIFGERNFVAMLVREAIKGGSVSKYVRVVHDNILIYSKNISKVKFGGIEVEGIELNLEDEKGKYAKGRELNKWGAGSRREDAPGMWYPIPGPNGEKVYPIRNDGSEGRWRLGKKKLLKLINDGDVIFEKRSNGTYIVYEKIRDSSPRIKQFTTLFKDKYVNAKGTTEIKKLFESERAIFDYSKPVELISDLLIMCNSGNTDIILDFFSGSATTAHAVMQLNAEDGGNRKYIMVQLPEPCDEKSEAYKAGYKDIAKIGKERIRRAGKKIKEETGADIDHGFRVFRVDSTNMKDVYYRPDELNQSLLDQLESNIKEDRIGLDLLIQVMMEAGLELSLSIKTKKINGKEVHFVAGNSLVACFDKDVDEELIKQIAKIEPLKAVFRDNSFKSCPDRINLEEIFKSISPSTEIKVL